PALYSAAGSDAFLDVTTGNNGYDAGPGYDYVTGLGSPWAPSVVSDLAQVDRGGNAPLALAEHSPRALLPTTGAFPVASDPLPSTLGVKNAVDTAFAEPGLVVVTTAKQDLAPMPSIVPGQAARVPVSNAGSISVRHSATPGQGLELSEFDTDPWLSNRPWFSSDPR